MPSRIKGGKQKMAKKLAYCKRGSRGKMYSEVSDWNYTEEAYNEKRHNTLKLMEGFGAIKQLQVLDK